MKNLTKISFLCGILLFVAVSCEEEEDETPYACGIENPQENIDWLKYILDRSFCAEIYLYTLNEQEFIGIHDCPGVFDGGWVIYNCDGSKYCQYIGLNASSNCSADFIENAKKTLIYKQND